MRKENESPHIAGNQYSAKGYNDIALDNSAFPGQLQYFSQHYYNSNNSIYEVTDYSVEVQKLSKSNREKDCRINNLVQTRKTYLTQRH